jgi:hypothetical protein
MRIVRWSALALALCRLASSPPPAQAGIVTAYNEDATLRVASQANDFEIVVAGNQTFGNYRFGFPGGTASSSYSPGTNTTTLTFSGATVTTGTKLHFGYTLAGGLPNSHGFGPPDALGEFWTFNGVNVEQVAGPLTTSISNVQGVAGAVRYLVLFAQVQNVGDPSSARVNEWTAIRLPAGQTATATFANEGNTDELIFNARNLFLTESDIGLPETNPNFDNQLLGMLDSTHLPLTDPRFTPIPGISDGMTVAANGGTAGGMVPEPTSVVSLGLGGILLAGYGWRRRRRATA